MKRILFVFAVFCLLAGCAGGRKPQSDEQAYRRFVGTWQNPGAQGEQTYARLTVRPDYTVQAWNRMDSPKAKSFTTKLKRTWVDEEGNTYCQFFFNYTEGYTNQGLGLMKLDKARKTLELNKKLAVSEDSVYPDRIERKMPGENWTLYMMFSRK